MQAFVLQRHYVPMHITCSTHDCIPVVGLCVVGLIVGSIVGLIVGLSLPHAQGTMMKLATQTPSNSIPDLAREH